VERANGKIAMVVELQLGVENPVLKPTCSGTKAHAAANAGANQPARDGLTGPTIKPVGILPMQPQLPSVAVVGSTAKNAHDRCGQRRLARSSCVQIIWTQVKPDREDRLAMGL